MLEKGKSINEAYWRNMSENELENFANEIFLFYRENGFPYYPTDMETRQKDFYKLNKFVYTQKINTFNNLFNNQNYIIKQTMHGLGLAWSYFPHSFNVKCNNRMTPYEAFMDDEIFIKVIRKRLKMGTYISDSGIRKMLKIYTNVQGVSNFRPTAAAYLYNMFGKGKTVWDMSGGWGGRLLGAIVADVDMYIATEPSIKTKKGLVQLANDFGGRMHSYITEVGSEDFKPTKNSLNFCFTSPPYFNVEKYADEPTQSYIKFNNKKAWVEGFLRPTFQNCYYGLKPFGYMLINIADGKGKENISLEDETIKIAKQCGFKYYKTQFKLSLSNINLRNKNKKYKFEPIFIFEK